MENIIDFNKLYFDGYNKVFLLVIFFIFNYFITFIISEIRLLE